MGRETLKEGFARFRERHGNCADELTARGQTPEYLFIGCMDSRAAAEIVFDLKPGDCFGDRPMGTLVPPYKDGDMLSIQNNAKFAFAASIGVSTIVVMGHTDCGVAEGLAKGLDHPQITPWLEAGKPQNMNDNEAFDRNAIEREIPISSYNNALSHPALQENIESGTFDVIVLLYDMHNAQILEYNPSKQQWSIFAQDASLSHDQKCK